jgi:hypothetical protein
MTPGNLALLLLAAASLNCIADTAQSGFSRLQNEVDELREQSHSHSYVDTSYVRNVSVASDRSSTLVMDCRFGDKLLSIRCQHRACSILVSGQA